MRSFFNITFVSLPEVHSEEEDFIVQSFRAELKEFIFPILVVVATIQTLITMYVDYNVFAFSHYWFWVRVFYFPFIYSIYKLWINYCQDKKYFTLLPVFSTLFYIGGYLAVLLAKSSLTNPAYQGGVIEILIGIAFLPFLFRTYLIMFVSTFLYIYSVIYLVAKDSLLEQYPLIIANYLPAYIFTVLLALVIWRGRIQKARLQFQLNNLLGTQAETIRSQSTELARAKVYQAVAETVQLVAHDVRKPFHMITSGMRMMKKELTTASSIELFGILSKNLESSLKSVNATLSDIIHVGRASDRSKLLPVDLVKVINEIRDDLIIFYETKNFTIDVITTENAICTLGDENKIRRAIFNIADNAVQALESSGIIRLTVTKKDKQIFVEIFNNGPVIPEEVISKIFEPMFTSGKKNGTGLGLHISKLFIAEHQGEISVTSSDESGTTFSIALPETITT